MKISAGFELRIGLLPKSEMGRDYKRQTGLPGLQYAVFRQQRDVSGLCIARSSQIGEQHIFL